MHDLVAVPQLRAVANEMRKIHDLPCDEKYLRYKKWATGLSGGIHDLHATMLSLLGLDQVQADQAGES